MRAEPNAKPIPSPDGGERTFLLPGEMGFSFAPQIYETLLGSCVAVCLHDPIRCAGGMNHFLVPNQTGQLPRGKVGQTAIADLLGLASAAGCHASDLKASILGGGAVTGHLSVASGAGGLDIGRRNCICAAEMLRAAGITVVKQDIGGPAGRRIRLDISTGSVLSGAIPTSQEHVRRVAARDIFAKRRIKVLIVDDSATVRAVLRSIIARSDDLEVCGEAADAFAARAALLADPPDVLCLDVIMPQINGLQFLRKIMEYRPIPTVIVSTVAKAGSDMERLLKEAGAAGIIDKDSLSLYRGPELAMQVLLPALRRAAIEGGGKAAP